MFHVLYYNNIIVICVAKTEDIRTTMILELIDLIKKIYKCSFHLTGNFRLNVIRMKLEILYENVISLNWKHLVH